MEKKLAKKLKKNTNKATEKPSVINLRSIYKDKDWPKFKNKPVIPLGAETDTHNLVGNLENYFNIMIGGRNDSGKSTFLHCAIINLLRNTKVKDLRFIFIDTKKEDLVLYKKLPNLIFPIVSDRKKAKKVLDWCINEINLRSDQIFESLFEEDAVRKPKKKRTEKEMPRILIIVSNYSDLIKGYARYFEKKIAKIAESGSFSKVNIIVSTPAPTKGKIYPKKLVNNFNNKIVFSASSASSKCIIGKTWANKLSEKGATILEYPEPVFKKGRYKTTKKRLVHLQGFYLSEDEIKSKIKSYIKK